MTRAIITRDEWYPVFELVLRDGLENEAVLRWFGDESVDVPQELIDRHAANLREFKAIQEAIKALDKQP